MAEHPILFSTSMVKAILEGCKTQTRRVIALPRKIGGLMFESIMAEDKDCLAYVEHFNPYGQPGDHLWVRETFISGWPVDGGVLQDCDENGKELPQKVWYRADGEDFQWMQDDGSMTYRIPWKPSIHMPRWASRITLEITGIRVERVQEINNSQHDDVLKEGWPFGYDPEELGAPKITFARLWDSINAKRGYGWDVNPWVWVVEFKKI